MPKDCCEIDFNFTGRNSGGDSSLHIPTAAPTGGQNSNPRLQERGHVGPLQCQHRLGRWDHQIVEPGACRQKGLKNCLMDDDWIPWLWCKCTECSQWTLSNAANAILIHLQLMFVCNWQLKENDKCVALKIVDYFFGQFWEFR